jgi:uncharacterized oligopeptide transporter (OPT) family protein
MAQGTPNRRPYRELTISAVVFAIVLGAILNAAITYSGLRLGFTVSASAIAVVLGFGVLRGLVRQIVPGAGTIVETNIAQTATTAIQASCAGIIFTVPVLFLMGVPLEITSVDTWLIAAAGSCGGLLGVAFIIPLRKQMIEVDRLRFPSGTAGAVILKSPGAGAKKAIVLGITTIISMAVALPANLSIMKFPAELSQLDSLVARERIDQETAERTRAIAEWIATQTVPVDVLARGAALHEVSRASDALRANPTDAGLRATREAARAALDGFPVDGPFNDALCKAAFLAKAGGEDDGKVVAWDDLRTEANGWAMRPLLGYQDIGWRLPATPSAEDPARLSDRVDFDGNGKPDLVLTDGQFNFGRLVGFPDSMELIFSISLLSVGAGFLSGKAGMMTLFGGILAYLMLTPLAFALGWLPDHLRPHEAPGHGFSTFNRPLGIGLLLGGAIMGIIASLPAVRAALKSIASAKPGVGGREEMGLPPLVLAIVGAIALLYVGEDIMSAKPINRDCPVTATQVTRFAPDDPAGAIERPMREFKGYRLAFTDEAAATQWDASFTPDQRMDVLRSLNARPGVLAALPHHVRGLLLAVIGAAWIWLAGIIIAQCTGMTDWSPISGMALLTVVLIMTLAGTGNVLGAVLIGAALCVAISLAADMMQDLKTGHLIGAKPIRQQGLELALVAIGPMVTMAVLMLIVEVNRKTYGVPIGPPTKESAPQAQALQTVIIGVQGGALPYMLYGVGAVMGVLLGLGAFSGLGVLVGLSMYLPFDAIATYGIGCVIAVTVAKIKGKKWAEEWGVPAAAGLIVGESVLTVILSILKLMQS